ncbi:hypothetical protein V2O64_16100 [Verrucomicrobiaceae bacterium 227]
MRILFFSLLLIGATHALVIRHDTPTLDYENYGKDSRFEASTGISRADDAEYGIAGATAIDSRWGVHARHTLKHVQDYMDQPGKNANLRGTKWNGYNNQGLAATRVNQVIHFDDDFTRFASAIDIAVVQTVGKSSTLKIAPLNMGWDEVGRVGSGASAANNRQDGNGDSRKTEAQNTSNSGRWYEVRWAGKNDINQVNTQSLGSPANALLKVDLDHPTNASKSTMGGTTAIDLEYGSMNGDSGSPIYLDKNGLNGQVAGVLSGGTGNVYGTTVVYVRIRPYINWIKDTIIANPDNRAVYLATIPDQIVNLGETLTVTESSTGTEQGPLTPKFSLVNPPTGAAIDSDTGVITWTPAPNQSGKVHTINVKVTEDGVVANSKEKSFNVTVNGDNLSEFWTWSGAPTNWSAVTLSGGNPYALASNKFPYLQGDTNTQIYQQITGTLPAWAIVSVQIKLADFEQSWSNGGPLEFGFTSSQPTPATASDPFLFSTTANVLNYDSATGLADGLGNTGGNVDYSFSFQTTTDLTNPWFAVRKSENGDRFAVDDIVISYFFIDTDEDGLPDPQELSLGTDPGIADSDSDGVNDGDEVALGSNPLAPDSDQDGYSDGYEVNTLSSDPLDESSPGGPNTPGIGINFVSSIGLGIDTGLPVNATAGHPDVAQKNWNQTSAFNANSGTTARIASPQSGVIVDHNGDATPVTMSYTMANTWSANNEKLTPYGGLYSGYLDTSASTPQAVISLSDIPYPEYQVYVYFGAGTNGRSGTISDGATTYSFTSASVTTSPGSYRRTTDTGTNYPAASYALFTDHTTSDLTLTYQRVSGNGGIYAIQIVPVITLSPYEQWAIDYNLDLSGNGTPELDADLDGNSNFIEFALNSDPTNPLDSPMLIVAGDPDHLSLTFQRSKIATTATVITEWSDNLHDWFSTEISETQTAEDAGSTTHQATLPKNGKPARFLRIRVVTP